MTGSMASFEADPEAVPLHGYSGSGTTDLNGDYDSQQTAARKVGNGATIHGGYLKEQGGAGGGRGGGDGRGGEDSEEEKEEEGGDGVENKAALSTLTSRGKVTLALCACANMFAYSAVVMIQPFFPQEAARNGVSSVVIGVIFGVVDFVMFIISPLIGNYLTRIGSKFLFVAGLVLYGLALIVFGFVYLCPAGTPYIVACFLIRAVGAVGLAAFTTSSFAIVSNEFPKHVSTVFGILETFGGIGWILGPLLGSALYEAGGFGLPFFIVGGAVCFVGFFIYCTLPLPVDVNIKRKASVFRLFRSPLVLVALLNVFTVALSITVFDPSFAPHLEQLGLSTLHIGLVFVIVPALFALTSPLWGYLSDRKDVQAPVIIAGSFFSGVGYMLFGPTRWLSFLPYQLWVIIVGNVLVGLFFGSAVVSTLKCLVKGAFEIGFEHNLDTYGVVSGLLNTAYSCGAFAGPVTGGALSDSLGFSVAMSLTGVLNFVTGAITLVYFSFREAKRRKSKDLVTQVDEGLLSQDAPLANAHGETIELP